ncbi:MAG: hypothetical protein R6U17_05280, partial [Thermoplasmata archaeon]
NYNEAAGGGGSSYNNGDNQYNEEGVNEGHGFVEFEFQTFIRTVPAAEVTPTSATFHGNLSLPEFESANVSFRYRKEGDSWFNTENNTMTGGGEFNETVIDLEPLTKYEFKAVLDIDSEILEGDVLVFVTGDLSRTTQLKEEWDYNHSMDSIKIVDDDLAIDIDREWHWLYEGKDRPTADKGIGSTFPRTWYAGVHLNVTDKAGYYITDVAYYDNQEAGSWARAWIGTIEDGAVGEFVANSSEYEPEGAGWVELELNEPLEIKDDKYWIIMQFDDFGADYRPIGVLAPFVENGQYVNLGDPHSASDWDDVEYELPTAGALLIEARVTELEAEGYRISKPLSLHGTAWDSVIHWNSTEPSGTEILVYTALTADENEPEDWLQAVNNGTVPGIESDYNITDHYLWVKQVLKTSDPEITPRLNYITKAITIDEPGEPHYILVEPSEAVVTAGENITYTAAAYDENDNLIDDVTEETYWEIETESGGYWTDNNYQSEVAGNWIVTGTYLDFTDNVTLTVTPDAVDYIDISPETSRIMKEDAEEYYATAYDKFGNYIGNVTDETNWSIEEDAGGIWDKNIYTSECEGEWIITGTYESVEGTATLVVYYLDQFEVSVDNITAGDQPIIEIHINDDQTQGYYLNITIYDKSVHVNLTFIEGSAVYTWDSLEIAGEYTADVIIGDITESNQFFVKPDDVHSVNISPSGPQSIAAGENLIFFAEAYDQYGNLVTNTPADFHWENVDTDGLFLHRTVGVYEVSATHGTVTSEVTIVTVEHGEEEYIKIYPPETTIDAGDVQEYTVMVYDQYDNEIKNVTEETDFSIEDEAGGRWDGSLYASETPGRWVVTGTYKNFSDSGILVVKDTADTLSNYCWLILLLIIIIVIVSAAVIVILRKKESQADKANEMPLTQPYGNYVMEKEDPNKNDSKEYENEPQVSTILSVLLRRSDEDSDK